MAGNLTKRSGWITFAGVAALIAGAYNALSGIAALSDDDAPAGAAGGGRAEEGFPAGVGAERPAIQARIPKAAARATTRQVSRRDYRWGVYFANAAWRPDW